VPSAFSVAEIADAVEAGLRRAFEHLDLEQAVCGLDVCEEIALHPYIAAALQDAGFGVHREQRYPAERRKRSLSEGERCDFVLTPDGRPLAMPAAQGTLFGAADSVELEEAFWLETKVISQFTLEGPNYNYSSQLLSTVRQDVTKLSKDQGILRAGLLIIMFVRDEIIAEHDLKVWQDKCLERCLPIGAPSIRRFPITNRHDNAICAIAVYPVSHL
jgi:hypothetical protein